MICLVQIQRYVEGVPDCLSFGVVHNDGQRVEVTAVDFVLTAWANIEGLADFSDLGELSPGCLVV